MKPIFTPHVQHEWGKLIGDEVACNKSNIFCGLSGFIFDNILARYYVDPYPLHVCRPQSPRSP